MNEGSHKYKRQKIRNQALSLLVIVLVVFVVLICKRAKREELSKELSLDYIDYLPYSINGRIVNTYIKVFSSK